MDKRQINVRVDARVAQWLESKAKDEGRSMANTLGRIIAQAIENEAKQQPKEAKSK